MINVQLTENEIDVLNGIAYHEMAPSNGAKPLSIQDTGTYCWADDFSKNLTAAQVKGVLSSLVQKKLIRIYKVDERDNGVSFTAEGFAAWQAHDDGRDA